MWQNWQQPGGMMMGYDGGWLWGMAMHAVVAALFFAILIAVVVLLMRWIARSEGNPVRSSERGSARELLDTRYAKGEIDREEYLQKKQDLG